jgi:uncharacterized protein (TIGR00369 family)
MSATTEPTAELLHRTRDGLHARCVVCGQPGPPGLGLDFDVGRDGSVSATFDCAATFEGYPGMLHGGVISAIADGAMTNCLFARGVVAVTAELNVRFRHPVELGTPLTVTARVTRQTRPLWILEATLTQAGQVRVKATGKFMETPGRIGST